MTDYHKLATEIQGLLKTIDALEVTGGATLYVKGKLDSLLRNNCDAIVRALREVPRWQPIETAPKDRTIVLGYGEAAGEISGPCGKMSIEAMRYCGVHGDYPGYDWGIAGDGYANWFEPTHWMPLPAPPQEPQS